MGRGNAASRLQRAVNRRLTSVGADLAREEFLARAAKAVAIEQRMDRAVSRNFNLRKSADQTLTNLSSTPVEVLALQVQDVVLCLKGQLVCVVMGPPASVCEPLRCSGDIAPKFSESWGVSNRDCVYG